VIQPVAVATWSYLAPGAVVVVCGDPADHRPPVALGEEAQLGEQRVHDAGAADGRFDIQVVEVAAGAGGERPGEGAVVGQSDDPPGGGHSEQGVDLVVGVRQPAPDGRGGLLGLPACSAW